MAQAARRQADESKRMISVQAAARILDCSGDTVRRRIENGEIEAFRHGRGWYRIYRNSVTSLAKRDGGLRC